MIRPTDSDIGKMSEMFGPMALIMLNETPISHVWRLSILVNFYTGPLYREIEDRFALDRLGFVVLFTLSMRNGLAARDIVQATGFPKNSLSRAIGGLIKRRLLVSKTDAKDKRAKTLMITKEGLSLVERIVPMFELKQNAMREVLTEDERRSFDECLVKMLYSMPKWHSMSG